MRHPERCFPILSVVGRERFVLVLLAAVLSFAQKSALAQIQLDAGLVHGLEDTPRDPIPVDLDGDGNLECSSRI